MRTFKNAVIVGRFQPMHIGHQKLINLGLSVADRVLIFVSSSDKSGTIRNPFDSEYRISLVKRIYNKEIEEGKVIVKPLNDLTNENDLTYKWGEYVVKSAEDALNEKLECIIYGKDKNIFKCFSKETVDNISEIFVDRKQLLISATKVREYIINEDKENFFKYIDSSIHDEYENLRNILLDVKDKEEC